MAKVLVIAIGNPLRGDDGLARRAAELLQHDPRPEVEILCVHQLTPELAEPASRVHAVIFMDASQDGAPHVPRCQVVTPDPGEIRFSHQLSPAQVMALAHNLYGASPKAFTASLRGVSFDHGETLSPEVTRALPELVAEVKKLIAQAVNSPAA